jgi:hypothetical protein
MNIEIGTKIGFSSAAGYKEGVIKAISISPSASGQLVPWIDVEVAITKDKRVTNTVRLCGSDDYLKMMKVRSVQ